MSNVAQTSEDEDIRPVIRTGASGNFGLWIFLAILALGGLWIVAALNAVATDSSLPRTTAPAIEGDRIISPPPLVIGSEEPRPPVQIAALSPTVPELVPAPASQVERSIPPPPVLAETPVSDFLAPEEPAGPLIVFEQADAAPALASIQTQPALEDGLNRVRAGRLSNPSMTIPQGTVIPAVLETALDSTRPGATRALVQRDIYGFDGSRVLIPRGSRLYGGYSEGLNPGERRALVQWTRLVRPDGVTIALDSPSADPLGRAGIEGDVDSRFLTRFGGAILQSLLDIGVGIATREASDGVIVALPGSTQNVTQVAQQQQVRPVLKVDHGTSVSVFVARDLDFSSVER